jgi:hypothetical protein
VPTLNKSHPRHPFEAARSFDSVGRGGMKSAAEPVAFTVLLGLVVLLAIFEQPVVAGDWAAERVYVVVALRRAFGLFTAAVLAVQALDKSRMGLVAVLPFRVVVRGSRLMTLLVLVLSHCILMR